MFPTSLKVVLPMLCSYMSHWWEHGPESRPADGCCTSVTSEHMNTLLGNILKIIYNNLGVDEGAWMKRLAGKLLLIGPTRCSVLVQLIVTLLLQFSLSPSSARPTLSCSRLTSCL